MDLTFLGTGSAMPTGHRAQSGLLLAREGDSLLVDCGSGVLGALPRTDVGYEALDALLLTHHHLDHVADALPLLKARWLAGADPLAVVGPPGTRALLDDLVATFDYLEGRVAYEVREVGPGSFDVGGFSVEARRTEHSTECYAYRVADPAGDVAVSGDTAASATVAAFADGAAVLVHDCSFPDDVDVDNHPTPSALGGVLAGNDYGQVYLTHLYPVADAAREALVAGVRANYDGPVAVAEDGETVAVGQSRR